MKPTVEQLLARVRASLDLQVEILGHLEPMFAAIAEGGLTFTPQQAQTIVEHLAVYRCGLEHCRSLFESTQRVH